MKKMYAVIAVCAVVLAGVSMTQPTEAKTVVTDELVAAIKTNCTENLASLNRLHQTDAFLRSNRGDLYQTISGKLMVPLNQRLLENEFDGSELILTTSEFRKQYQVFYAAYIEYDNAMSRLLKINCVNEPVTFYTTLEDVRDRRQRLNASDQQLVSTIKLYQKQFGELRETLITEGRI